MECPVCKTACESQGRIHGDEELFTCKRCGQFRLTFEAASTLPASLQQHAALRSVLSHFIARQQGAGDVWPLITTDHVEALEAERMPSPAEQRNSLILWIGDHQPFASEFAKATTFAVGAIIGAEKRRADAEDGLAWLHKELVPEQLFVLDDRTAAYTVRYCLTMKGWKQYEEIRRHVKESRTAFMAMQFNDPELDTVFKDCFVPAVAAAGFTLRPVTEGQGAGLIDNQIRVAIRTAAFVVADLSHRNNGAYFEAGFGEGLGLPVIYTCRFDKFKEEYVHFDTKHMVTVIWNPKDLPSAARILKQTVRNTLPTRAKMTDD